MLSLQIEREFVPHADRFLSGGAYDATQKGTYLLLDGKPYAGTFHKEFLKNGKAKYWTGVNFNHFSRPLKELKQAIETDEFIEEMPKEDRELRTYENIFVGEDIVDGFVVNNSGGGSGTGVAGQMRGVAMPFNASARGFLQNGLSQDVSNKQANPTFNIPTKSGKFVSSYDLTQQGGLQADGSRIPSSRPIPAGFTLDSGPNNDLMIRAAFEQELRNRSQFIQDMIRQFQSLADIWPATSNEYNRIIRLKYDMQVKVQDMIQELNDVDDIHLGLPIVDRVANEISRLLEVSQRRYTPVQTQPANGGLIDTQPSVANTSTSFEKKQTLQEERDQYEQEAKDGYGKFATAGLVKRYVQLKMYVKETIDILQYVRLPSFQSPEGAQARLNEYKSSMPMLILNARSIDANVNVLKLLQVFYNIRHPKQIISFLAANDDILREGGVAVSERTGLRRV